MFEEASWRLPTAAAHTTLVKQETVSLNSTSVMVCTILDALKAIGDLPWLAVASRADFLGGVGFIMGDVIT